MEWKKIAGQVAPVLGTLLGGPAGGTIGSMVAGALGVNDSDTALNSALADPEQRAKLQKWAYEHREALDRIQLETLQAELKDKQSAREAHKHSVMPAIICIALVIITAGFGGALFIFEIPEGNQSTSYMLLGQLLGWTGAAIAYWVGTTRSSAEKSRGLAK